jgi:hypothetical protein
MNGITMWRVDLVVRGRNHFHAPLVTLTVIVPS